MNKDKYKIGYPETKSGRGKSYLFFNKDEFQKAYDTFYKKVYEKHEYTGSPDITFEVKTKEGVGAYKVLFQFDPKEERIVQKFEMDRESIVSDSYAKGGVMSDSDMHELAFKDKIRVDWLIDGLQDYQSQMKYKNQRNLANLLLRQLRNWKSFRGEYITYDNIEKMVLSRYDRKRELVWNAKNPELKDYIKVITEKKFAKGGMTQMEEIVKYNKERMGKMRMEKKLKPYLPEEKKVITEKKFAKGGKITLPYEFWGPDGYWKVVREEAGDETDKLYVYLGEEVDDDEWEWEMDDDSYALSTNLDGVNDKDEQEVLKQILADYEAEDYAKGGKLEVGKPYGAKFSNKFNKRVPTDFKVVSKFKGRDDIPMVEIITKNGVRANMSEKDLKPLMYAKGGKTEKFDKSGKCTGYVKSKYDSMCANCGSNKSSHSYAKGGEIDVKIKDWYTKNYPTDDLGEEINATNTFEDLWNSVQKGDDVYDVIGEQDSLLRERLFEHLAKVKGVEYQYIYHKWLDTDGMMTDEEIKSMYAKGGMPDTMDTTPNKVGKVKFSIAKGEDFDIEVPEGKYRLFRDKPFNLPTKVMELYNKKTGYNRGNEKISVNDSDIVKKYQKEIQEFYNKDMSRFAKGGRILVGRFDEKQLKNKEDKKEIEKAQKESGLTYIDSKIIKKGGKMFMEVHLIPNEEYYNSSKFAKGGKIYKIKDYKEFDEWYDRVEVEDGEWKDDEVRYEKDGVYIRDDIYEGSDNLNRDNLYAKGGKIEKKGNEMILGGLAGVLLGIFFNK